MNCSISRQWRRFAVPVLLLSAAGVQAEMRDISDDAMSDVWGRAMFELTNSTLNTPPTANFVNPVTTTLTTSGSPTGDGGVAVNGAISFTKVTVGAEMELDAEIGKLRLGSYARTAGDGGSDISADNVIFTGYQRDGVYYPFKVKNPYLEFAMTNPTDSTKREILGFRFGFEQVDGMLGAALARLSGRVMLTSKTVPVDSANPTGDQHQLLINSYGIRSDGRDTAYKVPVVAGVPGTPVPVVIAPPADPLTQPDKRAIFPEVEAVCLGRTGDQGICGAGSDTATKDFWISVNKVNTLYYPKTSSDVADYTPAQKGVWLNVTDNARVYYLRNTADAQLDSFKNTASVPIRRW